MGNHEAMMRMALDPRRRVGRRMRRWRPGDATAAGARRGNGAEIVEQDDASDILELARSKTPEVCSAWLGSLHLSRALGRAVVRPRRRQSRGPLETFLATPWNMPLSEIDESNHWTWVREPFLGQRPVRRAIPAILSSTGIRRAISVLPAATLNRSRASVSTSTAAPAIQAKPSWRSFAGGKSRC